jgi:hypothetical protein
MTKVPPCKKLSKKFPVLIILSILFSANQSFSNPPIEVASNIENSGFGFFSFPQSVAGNGDSDNFGKEPFDNSATNSNSIVVSSGIFVSGDVYGTKLSLQCENNTPKLNLYTANSSVDIYESANVSGDVYGVFASGNLSNYQHDIASLYAQNNTVNLLGHTDRAVGGHCELLRVSTTSGNIFNLTSSNNEINASGYTITLKGGSSRISAENNVSSATFNISALYNTAISNSSDYCYGGYIDIDVPLSSACVFNLEALNNTNISHGNEKFIYGGYVATVANYSNNSNFNISASKNLIDIFGSVSDICCGGYISVYGNSPLNPKFILSATSNTVILQDTADISKDCIIYGGFCNQITNPTSSLEIDVFSGNTLETHKSGVTVYGVNNFENYIFCLPSNIKNGDIIIKALNGTGEAKFGENQGNNSIDLTNVNITLKSAPIIAMAPGDKVILIHSGLGFEGSPKTVETQEVTIDGLVFSGKGKFNIFVLENDLTALLESKEAVIKPKAKSYSEGKAACTAFLNQGTEFIANKFIKEAVEMSASATVPYGAVSLGESKYTTGLHVNITGLSLAVGIGKKFKKVILGVFCEAGKGTYKTCNDFSENKIVEAKGSNEYKGVGALLKIDLAKIYFESSVRVGSTKTDYESDDEKDSINNYFSKYNYDALYCGLHLGGGYVYKCFDGYFRYMFTYQEAKNITLPTSETINFDAVISQKLRAGLKFFLSPSVKTKPYFGIAYDQEFDAMIKASASSISIEDIKLNGNSWVYDIGISFDVGNFIFDINGEGFAGKREGFAGNFKLRYII